MLSWEVSEEMGFRSMSIQWKQFAAVPSKFYLAANNRCSAVDWYWCNEREMTKASFLLHWYLYQVFMQWDNTLSMFYYDNKHFEWHKSCFNWHVLLSVVLQVFLESPFFCGTSTVAQRRWLQCWETSALPFTQRNLATFRLHNLSHRILTSILFWNCLKKIFEVKVMKQPHYLMQFSFCGKKKWRNAHLIFPFK